jgi:hypothetical protein
MATSHLDPTTTVPGSESRSVQYPEGASTLLSEEGHGPMPGEPWRITEEKEERSLDIVNNEEKMLTDEDETLLGLLEYRRLEKRTFVPLQRVDEEPAEEKSNLSSVRAQEYQPPQGYLPNGFPPQRYARHGYAPPYGFPPQEYEAYGYRAHGYGHGARGYGAVEAHVSPLPYNVGRCHERQPPLQHPKGTLTLRYEEGRDPMPVKTLRLAEEKRRRDVANHFMENDKKKRRLGSQK